MSKTPSSPSNNTTFTPDWAVPPGNTIIELMLEKNLQSFEVAKVLEISLSFLERLLVGEEKINKVLASKLETCFGVNSTFWIQRELNYRSQLKQLKIEKS